MDPYNQAVSQISSDRNFVKENTKGWGWYLLNWQNIIC